MKNLMKNLTKNLTKNKIKKPLIFIIIISAIIFSSCTSLQVKEKNLTRPVYTFQKTLILEQVVGDFTPYFNVWKNYPIDYSDFKTLKDQDEAKLFTAQKKVTFSGNEFIIKDKVNKCKYKLIQEERKSKDDSYFIYSIYKEDKIIGLITQPDIHEDFNFQYEEVDNLPSIKNLGLIKNKMTALPVSSTAEIKKKYKIEGEIKKSGEEIFSFIFQIKHNEDNLCSIFKQYSYAVNKYEIIINREFKNLDEPILICIGVFIDQVLKESGYQYKN